jgi:hypothetical protein
MSGPEAPQRVRKLPALASWIGRGSAAGPRREEAVR